MSDSYSAIAAIANDGNMQERMRACATQQAHLGNAPGITDPITWVADNRYVWASSPGWGEEWDSARETHWDDPGYQPGRDPAVITDAEILATVQALGAAQD
jgi:hypothetical protein